MKAIALLLTCALVVVTGAPFYQAEASTQPLSAAVQEGGKKRSRDSVNELKIERRVGEAVRLRADQLKRKNKAVAKAMNALESRGMRLAGDAGVSIVAVRKAGQMAKISKQDATIISGDYELTLIPFDDGNNATWEGVVYFNRPEGEVVYDTQLDITNTLPLVLHQQRYSSDGSPRLTDVAKNTGSLQLVPVSYNLNQPLSAAPAQPGGSLQAFVECAAAGCWAGIIPCRFAGPAWAHCAIAACLAVMLQCAIEQLW